MNGDSSGGTDGARSAEVTEADHSSHRSPAKGLNTGRRSAFSDDDYPVARDVPGSTRREIPAWKRSQALERSCEAPQWLQECRDANQS
jgi:hypothetical protein